MNFMICGKEVLYKVYLNVQVYSIQQKFRHFSKINLITLVEKFLDRGLLHLQILILENLLFLTILIEKILDN